MAEPLFASINDITMLADMQAQRQHRNAWNMTAGPSDSGVLWSRRAPSPSAYRIHRSRRFA